MIESFLALGLGKKILLGFGAFVILTTYTNLGYIIGSYFYHSWRHTKMDSNPGIVDKFIRTPLGFRAAEETEELIKNISIVIWPVWLIVILSAWTLWGIWQLVKIVYWLVEQGLWLIGAGPVKKG